MAKESSDITGGSLLSSKFCISYVTLQTIHPCLARQ